MTMFYARTDEKWLASMQADRIEQAFGRRPVDAEDHVRLWGAICEYEGQRAQEFTAHDKELLKIMSQPVE